MSGSTISVISNLVGHSLKFVDFIKELKKLDWIYSNWYYITT